MNVRIRTVWSSLERFARRATAVAIVASFASFEASAQADTANSRPVTLRDALAAMLAGHPLLESARALVGAAEGDAIDASLWTNPVVDASWSPAVRNNSYDAIGYFAFGVSQFFELAGAPSARGAAARREAGAVEAEVAGVVLSLSLDVEASVVTLRAAERRVEVLSRMLESMQVVERVVRTRVDAGAAPDYDGMRIAVALALARADVASAEADVRRARGDFEGAVGPRVIELRGPISYELDGEPALPSIEVLVARANDSRPELLAADRRAEAAELGIRAASRSVFPGIGVRFGAGFGQSPGQWDLGLGVVVPIPAIDHGQGAIRAAEARSLAARASAEALRFAGERRLRGIHAEVTRRREALVSYRETTAPVESRILDEARAGYEAGRFSVAELADALAALRDSQLRLIDLATDARLAEVDLARAVGSSLGSR